ncbi:NAD(P)H oxidase regulator [Mycena venus]|uniref:NAD(P)H oxidase regulator n=1 Tax=Mycena venus TaxID=2733690 RepID=A0A8H6XKM5_9AGAR|nr:NAD(P)H oxidase regulator [Mycena venus]
MAVEQLKAEILAWQDALAAHDAGDFRGALRLFEPIADTAKIFVNLALIHDRLGEKALAIENFTRAIEMDKYLAIGYFQRGVSYFDGGQYEQALQDFSDAQVMMRTNVEINYDILGLNYKLKLPEILFNKWLTLLRAGKKQEGAVVLQIIMESSPPEVEAAISKTQKNVIHGVPFSLPVGTLYRPSANRMQLLNAAGQSKDSMHETPAQTARPRRRLPSLCAASSDTSSTYLPSISSLKGRRKYRSSISSTFKTSPISDDPDLDLMSTVVHVPKRTELNRVIGLDMTKPMNEIHDIPCAGVRISHGSLSGLMAWRFVVRLDHGRGSSSSLPSSSSIITNFILDTGSKNSYIPSETLVALGYRGNLTPGTEVTLRIQSVKTKCIVAQPEDAGRVGLSFMTAGSLTYYFDAGLVAPVLYDGSQERPEHVPRTIRAEDLPSRFGWLARILSLFTRSG